MAMTKKEKEYVAQLEEQVGIAMALRHTERVDPDIPVPALSSGIHTQGWTAGYDSVRESWSESTRHGEGRRASTPPGSASQKGIPLYSTKLLALKAVRYKMEQRFANQLWLIDQQIQKAKEEND